jgi:hypothetical protein
MNFNDDFDFDGYDDYDGVDDDFSEDLFEEEFEPEMDELEIDTESNEFASGLDFYEVMILGGMIVGQAYEEALDEKEQRDKKDNDDGEDLL